MRTALFFTLYGDEFGIALRRQGMQTGDQIKLVLSGGEHGFDNIRGNLDFDLRLVGFVLVEDVNEKMAVLFGDADV